MQRIVIAKIGNAKPVEFACDELVRYLKRIDGTSIIECRSYDRYESDAGNVIWLGETGNIQKSDRDEILIDVKNACGLITASNDRAVLIAAYRFLYELGCRFFRYGDDGEFIPKYTFSADKLTAYVSEKASYHHRSICIEGAVSYEHVYDIINWLPKVGLNGYYVQFQKPHTFFERWYMHERNPTLPGEPISHSEVMHIYKKLTEDMKKRGILYHAVGHGWTCEPLGIDGCGWSVNDDEISDLKKDLFAMVNGERKLWNGIALNTNLCYSRPDVRRIMTDAIAEYCETNPDVDYLHFWLADDKNNQCECEDCRKMRPADYYVMMLNELDEKLTEKGIDTKIVFLIYYDLLWKSEFNRIKNEDRFVLMFAPISRTYSEAFVDSAKGVRFDVTPYVRNKLFMPKAVDENLAFLKSWQEDFNGDSFDFDYHLMWDHVRDVGYYECARILHRDMCSLDKIGLNGMVSCQIQRCAFPTNLPMYVMARGLWDKQSDFECISDEYFKASFGEYGECVRKYLERLSQLVDVRYFRKELPQKSESHSRQFREALSHVEHFKNSVLEKHRNDSSSWRYLYRHAEATAIIIAALTARSAGDNEETQRCADMLVDYVRAHETELHRVLDVWNYTWVVCRSLECCCKD